jgi:uncharacterized protein YbaA (DUF1428 family)
MNDKIVLNIVAGGFVADFAKKYEAELKEMVNAKLIEFRHSDKRDAVKNTKIADTDIELSVRKL